MKYAAFALLMGTDESEKWRLFEFVENSKRGW